LSDTFVSLVETSYPITVDDVTTTVTTHKDVNENILFTSTLETDSATKTTTIQNISDTSKTFEFQTTITDLSDTFVSLVEISASSDVGGVITTVTTHKDVNENILFTSTLETDTTTKTITIHNTYDTTAFEFQTTITDLSDVFVSLVEISSSLTIDTGVTQVVHVEKDASNVVIKTTTTTTNTNDNTITVTETNPDESSVSTVYATNIDINNIQTINESSSPVTIAEGVYEVTTLVKDANGTLIKTITTTTNTNDGTVDTVETDENPKSLFDNVLLYDQYNTYSTTLTYGGRKYGYEWVLIDRVIGDEVTTIEPSNIGDTPDDFNTNYSRLGDMVNNSGEMNYDNIKTAIPGKYSFIMIPYYNLTDERVSDPLSATVSNQWVEEYDPMTTINTLKLGIYSDVNKLELYILKKKPGDRFITELYEADETRSYDKTLTINSDGSYTHKYTGLMQNNPLSNNVTYPVYISDTYDSNSKLENSRIEKFGTSPYIYTLSLDANYPNIPSPGGYSITNLPTDVINNFGLVDNSWYVSFNVQFYKTLSSITDYNTAYTNQVNLFTVRLNQSLPGGSSQTAHSEIIYHPDTDQIRLWVRTTNASSSGWDANGLLIDNVSTILTTDGTDNQIRIEHYHMSTSPVSQIKFQVNGVWSEIKEFSIFNSSSDTNSVNYVYVNDVVTHKKSEEYMLNNVKLGTIMRHHIDTFRVYADGAINNGTWQHIPFNIRPIVTDSMPLKYGMWFVQVKYRFFNTLSGDINLIGYELNAPLPGSSAAFQYVYMAYLHSTNRFRLYIRTAAWDTILDLDNARSYIKTDGSLNTFAISYLYPDNGATYGFQSRMHVNGVSSGYINSPTYNVSIDKTSSNYRYVKRLYYGHTTSGFSTAHDLRVGRLYPSTHYTSGWMNNVFWYMLHEQYNAKLSLSSSYILNNMYDNYTQTTIENTFGKGWRLIKSLEGGSTKWFTGDDDLQGYNGTDIINQSSLLGTQFLFTRGDMSHWMIADKTEIEGTYTNANRWIKRSSISDNPYQALWYSRGDSYPEDPWLSLEGHSTSITNKTVMYAENISFSGGNAVMESIHSSGMFVYTRNIIDVEQPLSFTTYGTTDYDITTDTHTFTSDLGNYLLQPGINNPSGGWSHTVSFWMYTDPNDWPEAHQGYVYALRSASYIENGLVGNGAVSQSGLILKRYGNAFRWGVSFGTRSHLPNNWALDGFVVGAWVHIAIVCDGYRNTVTVYENGVEKALVNDTNSGYTTNADVWNLEANSHLMVGKDPRDKLPFIGKISNFKIFDEALDANHINNLTNLGIHLSSHTSQRAKIITSQLTSTDGLILTGEVSADRTNDTTYHVIATTNPNVTNSEIVSIINANTYPTAIISDTVYSGTNIKFTDSILTNVIDINNIVIPSKSVNYTNVYVYATFGNEGYDSIVNREILPVTIFQQDRALESSQQIVMALDMSSLTSNSVVNDFTLNQNNAVVDYNSTNVLITGEDHDGKYIEFDGNLTKINETELNLDQYVSLFGNTTSGVNDPFTFDICFKFHKSYSFVDNDYVYRVTGGTNGRAYCNNGSGQTSSQLSIVFANGGTANSYDFDVQYDMLLRHTWVYTGTHLTVYMNGNATLNNISADFYGPVVFDIGLKGTVPFRLYAVNVYQTALSANELSELLNKPSLVAGRVAITSPDPYLTVTNVSEVTSNALNVSGTVFSSVADIVEVKVASFTSNFDLSNKSSLKAFLDTNGTTIPNINPVLYTSEAFTNFELSNAFNSDDFSSNTTETLVDGTTYQVVLFAKDVNGNIGILYHSVPYLTVTNVSEVTSNELNVSGRVFSSGADIVEVKVASFTSNFDLSNKSSLKAFLDTNGTTIPNINPVLYTSEAFTNFELSNAFNSDDFSSNTTETLVDGTTYQVVLFAKDVNGNIGISVL